MSGKPLLALPKLHFWGRSRTFGVVRKDLKNWGRGIPGNKGLTKGNPNG